MHTHGQNKTNDIYAPRYHSAKATRIGGLLSVNIAWLSNTHCWGVKPCGKSKDKSYYHLRELMKQKQIKSLESI